MIEQWQDFIGFGGEMEPEQYDQRENDIKLWKEICREKIEEAYNVYMERKIIIDEKLK